MFTPQPVEQWARRGPEGPFDGDDGVSVDDETVDENRRGKIRCPKCFWRPRKADRWVCLCGHAWNTFETRGRCPACGEQWDDTQCLACHQWSPHPLWYEAG
jgi:hypothetical protein